MSDDSYRTLISPDAYDYLDKTAADELLYDELLEEQEASELLDIMDNEDSPEEDFTENSNTENSNKENNSEENNDEMNIYSSESLFDSLFENLDDDEEEKESSLPPLIEKILSFLPASSCASYLKECDSVQQEKIEESIKKACLAWSKDQRDKMFTIPYTCITVALVKYSEDPFVQMQRLENIAAVMTAYGEKTWTALILHLDEDATVENAQIKEISKNLFSSWQLKAINRMAERIKQKL